MSSLACWHASMGQKLAVTQATWSHPPDLEIERRVEVEEEASSTDGTLNLLQVLRLAQQA